jgi:hypothetical protein
VPGGAKYLNLSIIFKNKNLLSIIKKSKSPQQTSVRNYFIKPFFLGPLQMTASSLLFSKNPIDITFKLSLAGTGSHPSLL